MSSASCPREFGSVERLLLGGSGTNVRNVRPMPAARAMRRVPALADGRCVAADSDSAPGFLQGHHA